MKKHNVSLYTGGKHVMFDFYCNLIIFNSDEHEQKYLLNEGVAIVVGLFSLSLHQIRLDYNHEDF